MSLRAVRLLLASGALLAAAVGAQPVPQGSAPAVEQKRTFVFRLLDDSPVARRIRAGASDEARQHLATAEAQYRQALAARDGGDLAAADKLLNDAIWSIGRARQLQPDASDELIHRRAEYTRLVTGLDALRASYQRHVKRSGAAADAQLAKVDAQLDRARSLAAAESFASAVRLLQEAERGLVEGMGRLLGSTMLYDQKFDTPSEEFAFELDRNRSYEELVPIALRERPPAADNAVRIDRQLDLNRALRDHARRHAERGEWPDALDAVRRGTGELQRALALAGVIVPTEMAAEGRPQ